jgi:hypothetical protein
MNYKEVSPDEFDQLYRHPEAQEPNTVYGAQFDSYFEVMDHTIEHANFIFKSRHDARHHVTNKYPGNELTEQMDLFQLT